MTNKESFNSHFSVNTLTTSNVRYFIIHLYVHTYNMNPQDLMSQTEEKFTTVNVLYIETEFWENIEVERKKKIKFQTQKHF